MLSSKLFLSLRLHFVLIITNIAFSTINVFGKKALNTIAPFPVSSMRQLSSAPFALILAMVFEKESLKKSVRDWKNTFLKVGIGIGIPQSLSMILYAYGLQLSNPVNCGILYMSAIPVTAILGMIFKYEERRILKVVGVFFSFGGALVMLELDKFSLSNTTLIGDLLIILVVFCYSGYLVFTQKLSEGLETWTTSFWMFLSAGVFTTIPIPFLMWGGVPISYGTATADTWISLCIICFIGTTLTYLCTNWGLQNTTSLVVAIYSPLELISTVIFAVILLDEELEWVQGVGAACILTGLLIVLFAKYKEQKEKKIHSHKKDELIEENEDLDFDF